MKGFGVSSSKVYVVPVSLRIDEFPDVNYSTKENFCLHVSRLSSWGKNVPRLVAAAKKYGFNLKLAGTLHGEERQWLDSLIEGANNIEYLGKLSDEKLVEIVRENFDLRPAGIIKMLDLRRPIYRQTAAYGHFGRTDIKLPWEALDKVEDLKKYL